jgi:hypothetical protein
LSVLSLLNLAVITAHLAVGAALLGSLVILFQRLPPPRSETTAREASPRHGPDAVAPS